jgi:hypothetical protein
MDERLRELDAAGLTFKEIADRMNAEFSLALTRNACVGRGRRLRLPLRGGAPPPPPKPRRGRKQYPKKKKQPPKLVVVAPPVAPSVGAFTMLQLDRQTCRWPSGTTPPYTYCGEPVHGDRQYCLAHCRMAFIKPEKLYGSR